MSGPAVHRPAAGAGRSTDGMRPCRSPVMGHRSPVRTGFFAACMADELEETANVLVARGPGPDGSAMLDMDDPNLVFGRA